MNHLPRHDNTGQARMIVTVARIKRIPTVMFIKLQRNGTYKIDPMISHMATASKAIEKKIAAHLRRYSNPIPTTVEQKKKMEILIIAAGLKGPSIRARGLIITSSMTTSKPNVNTPAGFNGFTFPFI